MDNDLAVYFERNQGWLFCLSNLRKIVIISGRNIEENNNTILQKIKSLSCFRCIGLNNCLTLLLARPFFKKQVMAEMPCPVVAFTLVPKSESGIPALIAVGIAIFHHKQKRNPLVTRLRRRDIAPSLRLLQTMMPESGGFLEAIPLTAFVSMCLIASGHRDLNVVEKGIGFLKRTQREDGSWPIDIDLSTWVTTLSVKALQYPVLSIPGQAGRDDDAGSVQDAGVADDGLPLRALDRERLTDHILRMDFFENLARNNISLYVDGAVLHGSFLSVKICQ